MAMKKDIILKSGLEIKDAYLRIGYICGDKNSINLILNSYISQDAYMQNKMFLDSKEFSFMPLVTIDSVNFIQQGYEYLKTLPEYADAIDC